MFRSAVFKLTIAYVAIVMTICVIFSVVLYQFAVHELQTGFYNEYTRWFNAFEPYGLRDPGTPANELAIRIRHIISQIVWFNVFVLVVTSIASYILAKRTLRPLEALHEQQKRFTADVSHELRTPLTALKMESEVALMDTGAGKPALREALTSNVEEAERMEKLINSLLLLSTIEAGKLRTEFKRVNLDEIVTEAVQIVGKYAESKEIKITSDLSGTRMTGDRDSLVQLFIILIENAVKYSPHGASVAISSGIQKGRPSIRIRDDGTGIPSGDLPHVFDRFYRADSARSKDASSDQAQGFGLGLSLAKLIADLHQGEIIISSSPGEGTDVKVLFPRTITV